MSTRSTINIEKEDKSVDSIYCHFDGYPTNVGAILLEYYTTEKKIKQLINLGDIVTLMPTVERIEPLRGRGKTKTYSNISKIPFQQYNYLWRDGNWWVARYEHGVNNKWIPLDQIIMENKSKNFYPFLNEIYHPILADEFVPAFLKKEFRRVVRLISLELEEENFSEIDIEDYLKDFIEEIVY